MQKSISRLTERPREPVPPTLGDTICHAPRRTLAGLSLAAAWLRPQQRGWRYEKSSLFVTSGCARGHLAPDVAGGTAQKEKKGRVCIEKCHGTNRITVIVKFCLENVFVIREKYLQMVADASLGPRWRTHIFTDLCILEFRIMHSYRTLCVCLALDICTGKHTRIILMLFAVMVVIIFLSDFFLLLHPIMTCHEKSGFPAHQICQHRCTFHELHFLQKEKVLSAVIKSKASLKRDFFGEKTLVFQLFSIFFHLHIFVLCMDNNTRLLPLFLIL